MFWCGFFFEPPRSIRKIGLSFSHSLNARPITNHEFRNVLTSKSHYWDVVLYRVIYLFVDNFDLLVWNIAVFIARRARHQQHDALGISKRSYYHAMNILRKWPDLSGKSSYKTIHLLTFTNHDELKLLMNFDHDIESLTQASVFSLPQLVSSLLDSVAEEQRVQVSTRRAAVNSSQPKHSQDCLNVST